MKPKVSVAITTYRHAPFLRVTLDSVLSQQTDFPFEVVVADDGSDDGSLEILTEYAKQDRRIRLLPRPKNLGRPYNRLDVIASCRGRYIANLDGDDRWISVHKLQRQADLMDAHGDVAISFHAFEHLRLDGPGRVQYPPERQPFYSMQRLLLGNFIATSFSMYRAGLVEDVPVWFFDMPMFDWPLHMLYARHGRIAYLDDVLGSYRWHAGGVWSPLDALEAQRRKVRAYQLLGPPMTDEYGVAIKVALRMAARKLAAQLSVRNESREARHYARMALSGDIRSVPGGLRGLTGLALVMISPRFYHRMKSLRAVLGPQQEEQDHRRP